MLPNPYSDPHERHDKMAISRDGSRLLVARLHCDGGYEDVPEHDGVLQRRPVQPRCKPVESVIAALHDLEQGASFGTFARSSIKTPCIQIRQLATTGAMRWSEFPPMVLIRRSP